MKLVIENEVKVRLEEISDEMRAQVEATKTFSHW